MKRYHFAIKSCKNQVPFISLCFLCYHSPCLSRLCTSFVARCTHPLCGFVFFVAKTSHPPKLRSPRSGSNQQPNAARQDAAPPADAQISVPCSGKPPWCQTPQVLSGARHLLPFERFGVRLPGLCGVRHLLSNYGADRNGDRGSRRNAKGAEITLRARRRCG